MQRLAVALLALLVLLVAADPSPRFLGLRRLPGARAAGSVTVRPVLEDDNAPESIAPEHEGQRHQDELASPLLAPSGARPSHAPLAAPGLASTLEEASSALVRGQVRRLRC